VITLAALEREVARRTGPFFQAAQAPGEPTSSTATSALMPALQTNALLGGPENLWLVRRGVRLDGTPTPAPINPQDRERMVQTFDAGAGRVIVDRNWQQPMYPNEVADFVHLHPSQELRQVVLAGLRRCFFQDRFGLGGFVYEADLTAALPWLIDPQQVLQLQSGSSYGAMGDVPFATFNECGHVWIRTGGGGADLRVTVLRSHFEWVNGEEAVDGPTEDTDCLAVDLDYAASAGHIEAWHLFPSRMFAAAAGNLQATQEMAAREFTRQAMIWNPQPQAKLMFSSLVSLPI
jgi:hypothetical protein